MTIVYGDSTPFPYGDNFIEISGDLIDCCVSLFQVQRALEMSAAALHELELQRKTERGRLEAFTEAIRGAVTTAVGEHARKIVAPVFEAAKAIIDREVAELEARIEREIAASLTQRDEARQATFSIIETFSLKHTLPGTLLELRLVANEKSYATKIFQVTPFGVEALFSTQLPAQSDWTRHRRVGDINPGTEVQLPLAAGWLSKRIEIQAVRLDKLFVSEVSLSEEKSTICLRKSPTSGGGYLLEIISGPPPQVTIATLGEDGLPTETARALDDDDYTSGLRLWSKLAPSTHGLNRRQSMLTATTNKRPLQEHETPEAIGLRLIQLLAPVLKEIARRSHEPGELVLRRDLGGGRREELYATKAELFEKIKGLPERFRQLFEPLELSPTEPNLRPPAPKSLRQPGAPTKSPSGQTIRSAPSASPSPAPPRQIPIASPSPTPMRSTPIASPSPAPTRSLPTTSPSAKISTPTSSAPTLPGEIAPLQSSARSVPVSSPSPSLTPTRSAPTLILEPSLSLPMATILEMTALSEEAISALLEEAPPHAVIPPSYISQEMTAVSDATSTVVSFEAVSFDEEAFRDVEDSTPVKR